MYILYFDGDWWEYYHATVERGWLDYPAYRPGEGAWLVPGTHPEDPAYGY